MHTTTVTVHRPTVTGTDRLGNPVTTWADPETVSGVLVAPSVTSDMEAARPDGITVALTLHFPKGYTASLAGCEVTLPAPWSDRYRVIGEPTAYVAANTPGPWDRPVDVEVAHG